jgi:hypothetical protein
MLRSSSLKTRLLVLTTIPMSALLVAFLAVTLRTAGQTVRESVRRSLSDAGSVFVKLLETRRSELLTMAAVTARDPRFFATFTIPEEERGEEFRPLWRACRSTSCGSRMRISSRSSTVEAASWPSSTRT